MAITNTSIDNQAYHEWSGQGDTGAVNWIREEDKFDSDYPSVPQGAGDSLAKHIVTNVFKLSAHSSVGSYGSYLPGYDVKNRDAYQMIQLSLAAEMAKGLLVECYVDEKGKVHFYKIGSSGSDIRNNILYQISTGELRQRCDNVIVVGYDPPPKKFTKGSYNLFTLGNLKPPESSTDSRIDTIVKGPVYHTFGDVLSPAACPYYREGYIEFADPGLNDPVAIGQGVVYDRTQFEELIGWIYHIEIPWFKQGSTEMQYQNKCPHYVTLSDFGVLQARVWKKDKQYVPALCALSSAVDKDAGVVLVGSDDKKFLGVREVYIYGFELKEIAINEKLDDSGKIVAGASYFKVGLDSMQNEPFRLSQGQDYVVVKESNAETYKIVFSANMSPNYIEKFGGKIGNASCEISPSSLYKTTGDIAADDPIDPEFLSVTEGGEYLKDGLAPSSKTFDAAIFPMGEGNSGYAIIKDEEGTGSKIVVVYDWANPCIAITDQENNVTKVNLELVKIDLHPIIVKDLPPAIAHNREGLLDASSNIADLNPKTVQNLSNNPYQKAVNNLENGDVKITLPFLNDGQLQTVAEFIYDLQSQVVGSTTYICDPDAEPVLGEIINDGVINSIDYSYQDSSQYLISVQAGPIWQGVSGWEQATHQNKVERLQLEGVVRYVSVDNSECLVSLERIGVMTCVNGQNQLLEIGDTVKVTVYNNPVSI